MRRKHKISLERKLSCYRTIVKDHIFQDYVYNRGLRETSKRIEKYKHVLQKYVNLLDQLDALNGHEPDWGCALDHYHKNYSNSLDSIEGNLEYISDRFHCQFRLAWMLEAVSKRIVQELHENEQIS